MEESVQYPVEASERLLVAGWFFSFLGGIIGGAIGLSIWTAQVTKPDGTKVYKYDEKSRKQGIFMFLIGIVWGFAFTVLAK